ncbi:hypothetical protein [Streptomyces sp. NRRL S-920]|uniref:hypothetical protein n=1 Tax=Streptomyces sp. NRRL S-920 TaxID=1463921 RepID=UPI000B2CBE6B|nr:hypothetical protein [Streptomyces sp. NRRL S-920]
MTDARPDDEEAEAREIWRQLAQKLTARGWYLSVGCSTVQICIPGNGGADTDRYVEVLG